MTTFKFVFRPSTRSEKSPGRLCLRVTHRRKSRQISLSIRLCANQWNQKTQTSCCEETNKQLSRIWTVVTQVINSYAGQGDYTVEDIILRYRSNTNGDTLHSFVRQLAAVYNRRGQERTARAYLCAVKRLLQYTGNNQLTMQQINLSLVESFERHLLYQGLARNTVSFYMRNLRAIYNKALRLQQMPGRSTYPFSNAYTGIESTRKRALTRPDINKIYAANLSGNKGQDLARNLFFFAFHARGMSFVDMAYLRKSDLKDGIIRYRRKKTRQLIEIKVTGELQMLIDQLSDHVSENPYLLPLITNAGLNHRRQYESALRLQNKRLSVFGKKVGFTYPLTTHVARHSWASLAKQINTPLAVISESLGHSNQKTTYTYLSSFDRSTLDKAGEKVSRLVHPGVSKPACYCPVIG